VGGAAAAAAPASVCTYSLSLATPENGRARGSGFFIV
jgi:hypothetical protein